MPEVIRQQTSSRPICFGRETPLSLFEIAVKGVDCDPCLKKAHTGIPEIRVRVSQCRAVDDHRGQSRQ